MDDEKGMLLALEEAKKAFEAQEVPVGAVLIYRGEVIASAHNEVEQRKDPTAHAEVLCIQQAAKKLSNWRLVETTLYSTLEPCPMCAGAIIQARIKRLVWGAKDVRSGAHGSFVDVLGRKHPIHQVEVVSGVLEGECGALMRDFFRMRREGKCGKNCLMH